MNTSPESQWESLVVFVEAQMQRHTIPGVAIGVLHNGETHTAGYGVTNVDHPLPVTDETLFQIGSITKTFTGTMIMQLVDQGTLDLNATVRSYLPEFKVSDAHASENATLRHLLTHMSGWVGDHFYDTGAGDDALDGYVTSMADLEQLAPLETVWSYNNAGFSVAGTIIERVTGKTFQQMLQERVLDPLGMATAFVDPSEVMTQRFAVGHFVNEGKAEVGRPWALPRAVVPAGGIACHVKDLLRYARFHLGDGSTTDGTRVLARESMVAMQTPQTTVWGKEGWGLSWAVEEVDGLRQVSHSGGTIGQVSWLILVPERDFAFVVFTNAAHGGTVTKAVGRQALETYLELDIATPTPFEAKEADLLPYVGRYSRPFMEMELGLLGGRLIMQMTPKAGFPTQHAPAPPPPPPMTLGLCENERLLVLDGPMKDSPAHIVRKADGTIGWLRLSSRIHPRKT